MANPEKAQQREQFSPDQRAFAYGPTGALPEGIIETPDPYTSLDFTVTGFETDHGSMNMRAADELLFNIVSNIRAGMSPEGRLFVVMADNHVSSAQILLQTALTENMSQQTGWETVFSQEAPFNNLAKYLINKFKIPMSSALAECFHDYDPDGVLYAENMLVDNRIDGAAQAHNRNFDSLLRHKTRLILMDASYEDIERDVPLGKDGELDYIEIAKYRNIVMAQTSANAKTDINILAVGANHKGNKTLGLSFKTSVQGRLAAEVGPQDRIVTIFPTAASSNLSPETTSPVYTHPQITQVVLRGLTEKPFRIGENEAENRFIQQLGASYPESAVPQRFLPLQLPSRDEYVAKMKAMVDTLEP